MPAVEVVPLRDALLEGLHELAYVAHPAPVAVELRLHGGLPPLPEHALPPLLEPQGHDLAVKRLYAPEDDVHRGRRAGVGRDVHQDVEVVVHEHVRAHDNAAERRGGVEDVQHRAIRDTTW